MYKNGFAMAKRGTIGPLQSLELFHLKGHGVGSGKVKM